MPKPTANGYVFRQQVNRIRAAVSSNRESLRRLNEDNLGPQTRSMLIAKAAMALSEIQEAVVELEQIGAALKKAQKEVVGTSQ